MITDTRPEWIRCEEPLAKKTTLQIGGPADYYGEPESIDALKESITWAKSNGIPYEIIGRGSNLLVLDDGFRGLVLKLTGALESIERLSETDISVGAGGRLKQLCGQAALWGIGGFEFLEGIPGSVGGALYMNAGAMGSWIWDIVESMDMLMDGEIRSITPQEADPGYRYCRILKRGIALRAHLRGTSVPTAQIQETLQNFSQKRKSSQPKQSSAGCLFKNPEGGSAGQWIDACGLKGVSEGGAEISLLHGNFMINKGGATAQDVIQLVQKIRQKIYSEKGIWLEPEVKILGSNWDALLSGYRAEA